MHRLTSRNLLLTSLGIGALALTVLFTTSPLQPAAAHECPPDAVSCFVEGRMTGGGRIDTSNIRWPPTPGIIVTHGFELHCDASQLPNGFQVNWNGIADVGSNRFHLETLEDVLCWDDPNISSNPPNAPFDTLSAHGYGRYNGQSGAFIFIKLTDAGEPGKNDEATIVVYDKFGILQLDVTGNLKYGNHQAHKATGK